MLSQPFVLVATTNPGAAAFIKTGISEKCRKLGLLLQVGPQGSVDGTFESSEQLFNELGSKDPADLLDTLLILDVGHDLSECFASDTVFTKSSWHVSRMSRPGIGMEISLRYPQLFTVFQSELVPMQGAAGWTNFEEWLDGWLTDTGEQGANMSDSWERVHFVTWLDGFEGVDDILQRFASGFRLIFDPTGFRTLLRNRFLAQVFGAGSSGLSGWSNTEEARKRLSVRLLNFAAVIDEEPDLTLLAGYALYKFGYRAWMLNSYAEFKNDKAPTWVKVKNLLIVRDVDLRLPDIPRDDSHGQIRRELRNIYSDQWKSRLNEDTKVRVLTQDPNVIPLSKAARMRHVDGGGCDGIVFLDGNNVGKAKGAVLAQALRLGQSCTCNNPIKYIGLSKPLESVHAVTSLLKDKGEREPSSLIATLRPVQDQTGTAPHGAPYANLRIATDLVAQARHCRESDSPRSYPVAALLAQEAYCLLLGMSKTITLAALREMNLAEAKAESSSTGMTYAIKTGNRRDDLKAAVEKISPGPAGNNFLAKMWSDLKLVYREGEQFEASEEANIESLANATWLYRSQRFQGPIIAFKKFVLHALISFKQLIILFVVWTVFLTTLFCASQSVYYFAPTVEGVALYFDIFRRILIAISRAESISTEGLVGIDKQGALYLATDFLCAITSMIAIGLIVSILFRKSTRG